MAGFQYLPNFLQTLYQQQGTPLLQGMPSTFPNGGAGYPLPPENYVNNVPRVFNRMMATRRQNERTNRFQPFRSAGFGDLNNESQLLQYNNQIQALGPQGIARFRPYSF